MNILSPQMIGVDDPDRVKELIGGLDWWKRDGHKTECAAGARAGGCGCESEPTSR